MSTDVIVIGAGLLGLSTAFSLAKLGQQVCVIDSRKGAGLETSFANGGMLHASQANPWNEPGILNAAIKMLGKEDAALLIRPSAFPSLFFWGMNFVRQSKPERYAKNVEKNARLARYSIEVIEQICASNDIEFAQRDNGTLTVFRSQQLLDKAAAYADRFEALEILHRWLDPRELVELEPALSGVKNDLCGGLYFPNDWIGDAHLYCKAIQSVCEQLGVEFIFNAEVSDFECHRDEIKRVVFGQSKLSAAQFVLACGSYSPQLAKKLGIRLPIQPVKGYSITTPVNGWDAAPRVAVIDEQMHAAVCPLGNFLRVAGTAEFAGYDHRVNQSRVNNLNSLLLKLYPDYVSYFNRDSVQQWAGLRPMTPDGVGITGPTKLKNLFINSGHGHLGWTMAPGAGQALADFMVSGSSALPLDEYSLSRF